MNQAGQLLLAGLIVSLLATADRAQQLGVNASQTVTQQETQSPGTNQGHQQHQEHDKHETKPSSGKQPQRSEPEQMKMEHVRPETQQPESPQMHMDQMHHDMNIPVVAPEIPQLGKAEEQETGPRYRLEELEQIALARNPTLAQAVADINSAKSRRLQSGLYPNPSVGYEGSEIRGGAYGGGEHGFFIEQSLVTAGKLGLNRKVGDAEITRAEAEAEAQRWRVLNSVRMAYYRVLAAQEMLAMKKSLRRIAGDSLRVARQLHNIGQSDDTEVLQAEIEDQAVETAVLTQQNTLARLWTTLATVVGNPQLSLGILQGNLEADLPELNEPQLLDSLLKDSPQVKMARAKLARAQAALSRARREPVPDIDVRAGMQQNGELLDRPSRSVGLQGFASIGVQIPIFNRNQGNVAAAKTEEEKAHQELERVSLHLRGRLAVTVQNYRSARIIAQKYHDEILPRAQRAYELMVQRYGLMTASYPQVLNLQRTLYQGETGYITALEDFRTTSVLLQGFLLAGGLGAPGSEAEMEIEAIPTGSMNGAGQMPSGMRNTSPLVPGGTDSSVER
jgi:cobalt-zinc-cadmium efflux system outer membrane protein